MQTPSRLTLGSSRELGELIQKHADNYYTRVGDSFVCKNCGTEIRAVEAHITIHLQGFVDCTETGKEGVTSIPFCPNCEERPAASGCIHIPLSSLHPVRVVVIAPTGFGGRIPKGY